MFIGHLEIFFWESQFKSFVPFFYWIICLFPIDLQGSLHILNISPLRDMYFANIFSNSVACLFAFLAVWFYFLLSIDVINFNVV